MAYDASFLTGSDERPVDPISVNFLHNDQEIAINEDGHRVYAKESKKLDVALESFDHVTTMGLSLHRDCRKGNPITSSMYRIINSDLTNISKKTSVSFDRLPNMESLQGSSPRELTFVLENVVTDFIKDMWGKLKAMFLNAHKKIKDWYLKAWDGSSRLMKQAASIKAKAENIASATPRESSIEMSGVKFLNINGKVASPQEIGQGVANIAKYTENFCDKNPTFYDKLFPSMESALKVAVDQAKAMKDSNADAEKDNDSDGETVSEAEAFGTSTSGTTVTDASGKTVVSSGEVNKLTEHIAKMFTDAANGTGVDTKTPIENDSRFKDEKVTAYRNPTTLLGSVMIVFQTPLALGVTTTDSYTDFKQGFKLSVEPISDKPRDIDDDGTFRVADTSLIVNICDNVISSCKIFLNYKLMWDKRAKALQNLTNQMDSYVASNSTLKGAGQKHIANSISTTVALVKRLDDGEARWNKYAMSVCNKAIVYCRNSINQY